MIAPFRVYRLARTFTPACRSCLNRCRLFCNRNSLQYVRSLYRTYNWGYIPVKLQQHLHRRSLNEYVELENQITKTKIIIAFLILDFCVSTSDALESTFYSLWSMINWSNSVNNVLIKWRCKVISCTRNPVNAWRPLVQRGCSGAQYVFPKHNFTPMHQFWRRLIIVIEKSS